MGMIMSLTDLQNEHALASNVAQKITDKILQASTPQEKAELTIGLNIAWDAVDELEKEIQNYGMAASEPDLSCPECWSTDLWHHGCGNDVFTCDCVDLEKGDYDCFNCGHRFSFVFKNPEITGSKSALEILKDFEKDGERADITTVIKAASKAGNFVPVPSCLHVNQKVTFPSGTFVYASALKSVEQTYEVPDFGLYAEQDWALVCHWRNEYIHWRDMDLPSDYAIALEQIYDALGKAQHGLKVDIGCHGAHGRTGTIIAIMLMLDQNGEWSADDCIKWVRDNYCDGAIETTEQEWFIEYAGWWFYDFEVGDKPVKAYSAYSVYGDSGNYACSMNKHFAMIDAGWLICADDGVSCEWWDKDLKDYEKDPDMVTIHAKDIEFYKQKLKQVNEEITETIVIGEETQNGN